LVAKRASSARAGSPIARHSRAEAAVVAHREREGPVRGVEGLIGGDRRVPVAAAGRQMRPQGPRRALVEEREQRRREERDLDVPAGARVLALGERGLDADHGEQPADEVDHRRARLDRGAVGLARDAHQPAHGLQQKS
jgi:hypothetical protein